MNKSVGWPGGSKLMGNLYRCYVSIIIHRETMKEIMYIDVNRSERRSKIFVKMRCNSILNSTFFCEQVPMRVTLARKKANTTPELRDGRDISPT